MKFRMVAKKRQRSRVTYELWMSYFKLIKSTTQGYRSSVSVPVQDIYVLKLLKRDIKRAILSWEKYSKFDSHIEAHIVW